LLHERHYTLAEANRMLETLTPLLRELQTARDQLVDSEAHELLSEAAPANGGGDPGRQVGEAFLRVRSLLEQVERAGIVLRDVDRGLVDFPSLRDGREVYLCWELGEDEITHWHDLETGFGGRQPLE
jgi:hypothetical protein